MRETVRKDWWGRVGCGRVKVWEGEQRKGEEGGIRKGEVKTETSRKGRK